MGNDIFPHLSYIGHMDAWESQALYINQVWYNEIQRARKHCDR